MNIHSCSDFLLFFSKHCKPRKRTLPRSQFRLDDSTRAWLTTSKTVWNFSTVRNLCRICPRLDIRFCRKFVVLIINLLRWRTFGWYATELTMIEMAAAYPDLCGKVGKSKRLFGSTHQLDEKLGGFGVRRSSRAGPIIPWSGTTGISKKCWPTTKLWHA